ncbi:uncharacterized protein LOC126885426 [Diabrotica virgifera virgifera]|uniref:Uncharacterized protein n=1 Tax=Diabrotica virgifera virgifera TaxID=50390 RepID=A0ABM5KCN2_DIAVI|nr:uncharacterized protein LOC126885426 [Diabrotica virgifera virgifera]
MSFQKEQIIEIKEYTKELIAANGEEMMKETRDLIREVKEMNQMYKDEIKRLIEENLQMKNEIKKIRAKMNYIEEVENRIETNDRENRKNNIIISGLDIPNINEKEIEDHVKNFVDKELKVAINNAKVRKIKNKTYLVKVDNFSKKLEIMKNKTLLMKGEYKQVYINNDLTLKERAIQNKLKIIAKKKRRKQESKNRISKINNQWREMDMEYKK